MTEKEMQSIRQIFSDVIAVHTAETDGKFELIKFELKSIKEQTTKTNGRVTKLEEKTETLKINDIEHITHCPNVSRIEALELSESGKQKIYKFITVLFGVCTALATLVIAYFEMKK